MPDLCQISKKHGAICLGVCNYTVNDLMNGIGQVKLQIELEKHKHPKSRKLNIQGIKRFANTEELKQELLNHYLHFHKNN